MKTHLLQMNQPKADDVNLNAVIQQFEYQVEKWPEQIALKRNDEVLSYEALNKKANQLAWALAEQDIKTGEIVAIVAEPSFEMFYGILAVQKLGATYLPVDTSYPDERIAYILENSQSKVCLTQSHLADKPCFTGRELVEIERVIKGQNTANLNRTIQPTDLAYVFYTSGSTGKPKGVMIRQNSFADYVNTIIKTYDISNEDTILQHNSFAFDSSIEEIFPTLCTGGQLIIPNDRKDLEELKTYISSGELTWLSLSPLMLNLINEQVDDLGKLRLIVVGGMK